MIVKKQKEIKDESEKRRIDDHCLRRALARLPFASLEARRRLRLRTMTLGFVLFGKKKKT
jgi:hypothetical protein